MMVFVGLAKANPEKQLPRFVGLTFTHISAAVWVIERRRLARTDRRPGLKPLGYRATPHEWGLLMSEAPLRGRRSIALRL